MKRPRRALGFRDAVVLSAPLLLLLLYLVIAATLDYQRAIQFDDFWSEGVSVEDRFLARAGALLRLVPEQRLKQRIDPEHEDPGMIRLQVDAAQLDRLFRDPQLHWDEWLDGNILESGGRLLPVRIHKRGDNSVHWMTDKKTLTVRTTREEFYKRYRSFGLSAKDVLTAYVANRLAPEFGLLAPSTTVVPVVLNNQYAGMFRFIEAVDESFLRPFDRMPGNIFRGDAAERGEYFKGMPRDLFANPYIWDRVAVSERPTAAGAGQLRLFLEDINGHDLASHRRLMDRVDREEIARMVAYLLLVGDPYHMDGVHNQLWYEDPSTALLHPIPWDIRLLPLDSLPQRELNGFLMEALRDPWLVDGVLAELGRRLAGDGWIRLVDSLAGGAWNRYHDAFAFDRLRSRLIPPLGHPDEIHRLLQGNAQLLRGWLADAKVAFGAGATGVLDFETRGFAGAELTGLEVSGAGAAALTLRADRNRNGVLDPDDPVIAGRWDASQPRRFVADAPQPLLPAWNAARPLEAGQPGLSPGQQHYRFFLVGLPAAATVRPELASRPLGSAIEAVAWEPGRAITSSGSFHPWAWPLERGRLVRLSGTVHLTADLRLTPRDTLVIEPGTTVRIAPDVSVVSRGLVLAGGTAARPILVTRADPVRPWGAFSLLGSGADSSRMRYVTFEGGGGSLVDRIEYIGMVNVHRARGVVVEHATFQDNVRSDDTFHALHADIVLKDSRFLRANSDALDLDLSTGVIEGNSFEDSGGDAIDLMTSAPVIRRNTIRGSRDKGISIGEASSPLVFDNRIERCQRGIEVKDRSAPVIFDNLLAENQVGIYEDRKNWRYGGGGFATVIHTRLERNRDSLRLDPFSRITFERDSLAGVYRDPAATLLDRVRFEEDFLSVADGWRGAGGVGRVVKQNGSLNAAVERQAGVIGRALDWDLTAPATLLLQAASSGLDSAEVVLVSPAGDVRQRLPLSHDPALFRLAVLQLPPRRYTALVIRLTPKPRIEKLVRAPGWNELKPAQFWVRGYDLYGAGAPGEARGRKPTT